MVVKMAETMAETMEEINRIENVGRSHLLHAWPFFIKWTPLSLSRRIRNIVLLV